MVLDLPGANRSVDESAKFRSTNRAKLQELDDLTAVNSIGLGEQGSQISRLQIFGEWLFDATPLSPCMPFLIILQTLSGRLLSIVAQNSRLNICLKRNIMH